MRAMVLGAVSQPLRATELSKPEPGPGQVALDVLACGVCRTDLHIVDGELTEPKLPLVLGHQIVARVAGGGERFAPGERVGVPWLGWTDGDCRYCRSGRENLCDRALFTGYDLDGGYAEHAVADERFCFPLPDGYEDLQVAPLLCAGLIGYRTLRFAGDAERIGIYGFGAAAHIICQVAVHQGRRVFAFTRADDDAAQAFALELGAEWAGDALGPPPEELDAALVFAPAGELVPAALRAVAKGGSVVCGGIHMSDIPAMPYELLWGERVLRSVANLTRADAEEFLAIAPQVPVRTHVEAFELERANDALKGVPGRPRARRRRDRALSAVWPLRPRGGGAPGRRGRDVAAPRRRVAPRAPRQPLAMPISRPPSRNGRRRSQRAGWRADRGRRASPRRRRSSSRPRRASPRAAAARRGPPRRTSSSRRRCRSA